MRLVDRLPVGPRLHRRLLRDLELRGHLLLDELVVLLLEPLLHGLFVVVEVLPQLPGLDRRSVLLDDGLHVGADVHERVLRGAGLWWNIVQFAQRLLHDRSELLGIVEQLQDVQR